MTTIDTPPNSWPELFQMFDKISEPTTILIDEFPYLVKSDQSLPSRMQKWLDHRPKKNISLILSGSSIHMMEHYFLNRESPLFGRAYREILVKPMEYKYFCQSLGLDLRNQKSFELYSLVGGVPKYWEFIDPKLSEAGFLRKDIPFGESPKNSKKVQYHIADQAMWFWFSIYSPLQSQWYRMNDKEKLERLNLFFSWSYEQFIRTTHAGSRYWDQKIELDFILNETSKTTIVGEVKYKVLNSQAKEKILWDLEKKWEKFPHFKKYPLPQFKVFDISTLGVQELA